MLPLQAIAYGLIVILFDLNLGDPQVDVVVDPLGWAACFYGVQRLSETFAYRSPLVGLAVAAGVVSLLLWIPGISGGLASAPESLLWLLELPGLAFVAVLALAMLRAAASGDDRSAGTWWQAVLIGVALTLAMPLALVGNGLDALILLAVVIGLGTMITCVVLCFAHAGRPWVDGTAAPIGRA